MSEPRAKSAIPETIETAAPPLLPPGTSSVFHGLRVTPNAEFSVDEPMANSSIFVVPIISASSSNNFSTTVALYGELNSLSKFEPHALIKLTSLIQMLSLIETGIPASFPTHFPAAIFWSIKRARETAISRGKILR